MENEKNMINGEQQDLQEDGLKEADHEKKADKLKRSSISFEEAKGDITVTAGQLIVLKRKEIGMSQEQLAWNCSMSRVQIGRIERNECNPGIETIEELESVLGIELYNLFMVQKRERAKKGMKGPRGAQAFDDLFERFEKELVRKGLNRKELKEVLDEALRYADARFVKENR